MTCLNRCLNRSSGFTGQRSSAARWGRHEEAFCAGAIFVALICFLNLSNRSCSAATVTQNQQEVESLWTRPGNDWPRFLGANIDGASSEKGVKLDWSIGKIKVLWTAKTGEGYGMGSVAAGRFFHFGKYGDQAKLKCMHAESGELLWEFAYDSEYKDIYGYDSGPRASPVIEGDRVYIFGVEGKVHCIDVRSGKKRWAVDTQKQFGVVQNFFGVGSTPIIFKDKLIVMVGGSPEESQKLAPGDMNRVKPNGTGVVAFDKMTGDVKYKSIDELASYSSLNVMNVNDLPLGLAWLRGSLVGFDPDDGTEKFSFPWRARKLESVNATTPVVLGKNVLISESYQNGSVLLDLSSGKPEVVWSDGGKRKKAFETHWNTPIVSGDYLFGCSGQHLASAEVRCVNWRTGEVMWSKRGYGRASLVKIDGHFVLLGEQGQLALIKDDPAEFSVVTEYQPEQDNPMKLKPPCWAAPVISHGLLYVRGKDKLVCLEISQ